MKRIVLLVLVFSLGLIPMFSQIINVSTDSSTIQAAIEAASDGDTILVAEGTYFNYVNNYISAKYMTLPDEQFDFILLLLTKLLDYEIT